MRDRANEKGEGGGQHKDPDAGLLWNVLIDAAARKEDELAKEEREAKGLRLLLWLLCAASLLQRCLFRR